MNKNHRELDHHRILRNGRKKIIGIRSEDDSVLFHNGSVSEDEATQLKIIGMNPRLVSDEKFEALINSLIPEPTTEKDGSFKSAVNPAVNDSFKSGDKND